MNRQEPDSVLLFPVSLWPNISAMKRDRTYFCLLIIFSVLHRQVAKYPHFLAAFHLPSVISHRLLLRWVPSKSALPVRKRDLLPLCKPCTCPQMTIQIRRLWRRLLMWIQQFLWSVLSQSKDFSLLLIR